MKILLCCIQHVSEMQKMTDFHRLRCRCIARTLLSIVTSHVESLEVTPDAYKHSLFIVKNQPLLLEHISVTYF